MCGLKRKRKIKTHTKFKSHPVWVCGLKPLDRFNGGLPRAVTPCMGVWIETYAYAPRYLDFKSHPVWVCGLKLNLSISHFLVNNVTPCMGVWIETS